MRRIFIPLIVCVLLAACGGAEQKKETKAPVEDRDSVYLGIETDTVSGFDSLAKTPFVQAPVDVVERRIHLQKGLEFGLKVPKGYNISVAYEGLTRLRFLTKSPDGRLFATDMYDVSDNKRGAVYIFKGWDSATHRFAGIDTFLQRLHNPNQVAFYKDRGLPYIYVSETGRLTRYPYNTGDSVAHGTPEQIAKWPDSGLSYKYGGWHLTRSLDFHDGKLYVSVGSSCNACIEKEDVRATIQEMNPDGSDRHIFARGLRNSVGIKWVNNTLWATGMGRDLLGRDKPEDLFLAVKKGIHYGWPYYFQFRDSILSDTAMQRAAHEANVKLPAPPPLAYCGFLAHSAPLGFDYFAGFSDTLLNNSFLVALHGSTTVSRLRGNAIVKITGRNQYIPIVDGFLTGRMEHERNGRPCGVLMFDERSFFFTDDKNGVLYYVWKE